jgi:hypothetical protein
MPGIAEDIFSAGDKSWASCAECKAGVANLSTLTGKYPKLKAHLENVFKTKAVGVTFAGDAEGAHFTAAQNSITAKHTGKQEDAIDLVDAIIFESYNAIRKDQFVTSDSLKDQSFDLVTSGTMTAQIEAGTMGDYYELAKSMDQSDRTTNMNKCMLRASQAKGDVVSYFLSLPHESDPDKLKDLAPEDERRLKTSVMYIYQNIAGAGGVKIRAAILTKCGVGFDVADTKGFQGRSTKDVVLKTPASQAATDLDALVKKNWPSATFSKRPGVLLKIIQEVQSNQKFAEFRAKMTTAAFGFTPEMIGMAELNCQGVALKA